MNNGLNIIFNTTDILNREVTLESKTWNEHIVSGHPEMAGNERAIQLTIEEPEFIYGSNTNPRRELFFARQNNSTYPALYTKAIVEYTGDNGTVTTAFFCKDIKGVNPEAIKYVKCKF